MNRLCIIGIALLSVPLVAAAEGRPAGHHQPPPEILKKYDSNGDGVLNKAERSAMREDMKAKRAEIVAQYDTDGDGKLNDQEKQTAREAHAFRGQRGRAQQAKTPHESGQ